MTIDRTLLNRASDILDKLNKIKDSERRSLLLKEYFRILGDGRFENLDVIAYRLRVGRPLAAKYIRAQRRLEIIEARILFGEE